MPTRRAARVQKVSAMKRSWPDAAAHVAHPGANHADRVAEIEVGEQLELVTQWLEHRQRHERAQHVVGALEDRKDADVAHDLLVGLGAEIASPALELHRAVGL